MMLGYLLQNITSSLIISFVDINLNLNDDNYKALEKENLTRIIASINL